MNAPHAPLLLSWPKTRHLHDAATGDTWTVEIQPGRVDLYGPGGEPHLVLTDLGELRSVAMAAYAAVIEHDQARSGTGPGQGRAHLKHQRRRAAAHSNAEPPQGRLL